MADALVACLCHALQFVGAYALAYWAARGIEPLLDRPRVTPGLDDGAAS